MQKFIKQNEFAAGVTVLILIILVFVYFNKQISKTSIMTDDSRISQFINTLPNGDVEPEKCKQLVSDMQNITWVVDSKYIYSKKLCLANLDLFSGGTYPNVSSIIQIFDLGSNEIFAEYYESGPVNKDGTVNNEKLFLWGKEQQKPLLSIVNLWLNLKEQF